MLSPFNTGFKGVVLHGSRNRASQKKMVWVQTYVESTYGRDGIGVRRNSFINDELQSREKSCTLYIQDLS